MLLQAKTDKQMSYNIFVTSLVAQLVAVTSQMVTLVTATRCATRDFLAFAGV